MTWRYRGRVFREADIPEGIVGFVYQIECVPTGRRYFGQKKFTKAIIRKPLKGKKRRRRSRVSSNWLDYWGSSQELQDDVARLGTKKFRRSILYLCKSKGEMNYRELCKQIEHHVLLHPDKFYNSYAGTRIHASHLRHLREAL